MWGKIGRNHVSCWEFAKHYWSASNQIKRLKMNEMELILMNLFVWQEIKIKVHDSLPLSPLDDSSQPLVLANFFNL